MDTEAHRPISFSFCCVAFAAGQASFAKATRFPLLTSSNHFLSLRDSYWSITPKCLTVLCYSNLMTPILHFSVFLGRKESFAVMVLISGRRKSKNEVESSISERKR